MTIPAPGAFIWIALAAVSLAVGGWLALRHALATHPVAVLDTADRVLRGGDAMAQVAAVRFGPDPAQKLAMFVPHGASGPRPVVVFIHGGSWASGDPADYRFIARALTAHGYAVVLAGYRLFPRVRYPAMLEDGAGALRWVAENAARHGGDPQRIVVMGHSAGAYNAVMLALDSRWLGAQGLSPAMLRGAIGLSGPYDFLPFDKPSTINSFGQAPDPRSTQPVAHARRDAPPLLLLTGDADTVVKPRNTRALATAMAEVGAPVTQVVLAGATHEDTIKMFARPFDRDRRLLDAVLPFLADATRPAPHDQPSGMVQATVR